MRPFMHKCKHRGKDTCYYIHTEPLHWLFGCLHDSQKVNARCMSIRKKLSSCTVIRCGGQSSSVSPSACYSGDRSWALSPFSVTHNNAYVRVRGLTVRTNSTCAWVCVCVLGERLSRPDSLSLRISFFCKVCWPLSSQYRFRFLLRTDDRKVHRNRTKHIISIYAIFFLSHCFSEDDAQKM